MLQNKCTFAVSSLSCAPANILRPDQVLFPAIATSETVTRLVRMRTALKHILPTTVFTTSFHVGYLIDTEKALQLLAQEHVPVSSLDTPDIRTLLQCITEMGANIKNLDIKELKENIGWQLASVTTYTNYEQKVSKGLEALPHEQVHFVRTSTGSWYQSELGNTLIQLLKEKRKINPSLALAIEIDARNQTPHEYFSLIQDLYHAHPDLPIYYDLDIGHLAESLHHHATFEHETLIQLVEEVLLDPQKSKRIGLISLNQYDHLTKDIHVSLMKGSIDYIHVMKLLGKATRAGNLSLPPTLLAEFSPIEYDEMISAEGVNYFKSLLDAFYYS